MHHQPRQVQQPKQYRPQQQPVPRTATQSLSGPSYQPAQQSVQQPVQQPLQHQPPQAHQQPRQQPVDQPMTQAHQGEQTRHQHVQQPELGDEAAHAQQQFAPLQQQAATSPYVDIYESSTELTIFADLPGCRSEDVQLHVSNRTLRITAERQEEVTDGDRPLQRERLSRGERTITLPVDIDLETAEATCENGVCKITLPKSEDDQQKTIGVQ